MQANGIHAVQGSPFTMTCVVLLTVVTSVTVYGLNHTDFFTIRDQQYNVALTNLYPGTVFCYKVVATNTEELRIKSSLNFFTTNEIGKLLCMFKKNYYFFILSSKWTSYQLDCQSYISQHHSLLVSSPSPTTKWSHHQLSHRFHSW